MQRSVWTVVLVVVAGCAVKAPGPVSQGGGAGVPQASSGAMADGSGGGAGGAMGGGAGGGVCPPGRVVVFNDEGYHGESLALAPGRYDVDHFDQSAVPNDSIRSVCVPAGCTVTLYEHGGFGGQTHTFTQPTPSLGDFGGSASGAVVVCP